MRLVPSPRALVRGAWVALLASGEVGAQSPVPASAQRPVTIAGSQLRSITSKISGREYEIQLLLPADYDTSSTKRYPVVYVLDGQWDFKLMAAVQGGLVGDKFVPDLIVVGITYPGAHPDFNALRAADLTPFVSATDSGSGGAPRFLAFLERELIPFVESSFRADSAHRVLLGNSLGGLFTLYAMLSRPGLFYGYVASSPSVTYANRGLFATEREFSLHQEVLSGLLFIGVGEDEPLAKPVKEFSRVLKDRGYRGLVMTSRVIENERLFGNKPETFNRGLRFVFAGKP